MALKKLVSEEGEFQASSASLIRTAGRDGVGVMMLVQAAAVVVVKVDASQFERY